MDTQEGVNILQLAADIASDWHDALHEKNGEIKESVILMTSLLNAQNHMFKGRNLKVKAHNAKITFLEWAYAYDAIFMQGRKLGLVPRDEPEKKDLA